MDDGAYAIAANQLQEGRWDIPYGAVAVDPDGDAFPYLNAEEAGGTRYPYIRQPLWVVVLTGADSIGEAIGMRILVIAMASGAIVATGSLARQVDRAGAGTLAAVLVALSPLAYNSLQLWAHAGAMLGVAVAVAGALRFIDGRYAVASLSVAASGGALAGALRADGAVYALAAGLVVGVSGLRSRRLRVSAGGAVIGVAAVAAQVASGFFAEKITEEAGGSGRSAVTRASDGRSSGDLVDRLDAAAHTVLSTTDSSTLAYVMMIVALCLVVYGVWLMRRDEIARSAVAIAVAGVLWLIRILIERDDLATGLVGAWPLVVLVAVRPWMQFSPHEKRLVAIVGIGTLGVLVGQYDGGGGLSWGGRFVSASLPLLSVLVASSILRVVTTDSRDGQRFVGAVLFLGVVTMTASLFVDSQYRTNADDAVARIEQADPAGWVVSSVPALPNLAWRSYEDVRWLLVPDRADGGADRMHEILEDLGVDEFVAYGLQDSEFRVLTGTDAADYDPSAPTVVRLGPTR